MRRVILSLVLPLSTPNLTNGRRHWRALAADKKKYYELADGWQLTGKTQPPPQHPFGPCHIAAIMHVGAKHDADNLLARFKWAGDWLESRGYVVNDRDLVWRGIPEQVAKRGVEYRIELTLETI